MAAADDFNGAVITLTFASGISSLPCPIPLVNDQIIEDLETFQLSLSFINSADGSLSVSTSQPSVVTATITDDGKKKHKSCFMTYTNLLNVPTSFAVPLFGFDPKTYMEDEDPSRTAFVTIVEVNGQLFAPGVTRILNVNSQPSGANPASKSVLLVQL